MHRVRITERKAGKVDKLWRRATACAQFRILVGGMALLRSIRLIAAGRALAGMTQADLAGAAGISLSVLQAVEHGKSDPKLSTLLAVIDALKAQGVELLANSDSVAWGVYVVPGSPAAAGGKPQPEMGEAPEPKRRGRPPGKSSAMPR